MLKSVSSSPLLMADFFSGAGGMSLGLRDSGFEPVYAFDSDRWACQTYRANLGDHIACAKASDLTAEAILTTTGLSQGDLALVCGGPPCQGFSTQRRGEAVDSRNDLLVEFFRLAVELKPAMIFMENVAGVLGRRGSEHLAAALSILDSAGYLHTSKKVDAADYGVPQHRKRALLVAWDPSRVKNFAFPAATHRQHSWRTVRQVIGSYPEPPDDYTEHPELANHTKVKVSALNEERIRHVPPGGGRLDLPMELRLACHANDNGHRHLDVYGRMQWDRPSPTITAMFDNFTRGRFAHPVSHRSLTGREGAEIQTFPRWFRFFGPKKDVARQIGNAVPPILAKAIGEALVAALAGKSVDAEQLVLL